MSTDPIFSKYFRPDDADLSFISSDSVVFQIHSRNLECICGGFAPSGFTQDKEKDLIALSEDAETLEILFQFVYPRAHPELDNIKIDLLLKVAEAAQKYQVFSALNICNIRLRENVKLAPIDVLIYGFKHDRPDLMRKAVPYCEDVPLTKMVKQLPPALFIPWVDYYEQRRSKVMGAFMQALKDAPSFTTTPPHSQRMPTTTTSRNSSTSSGSTSVSGSPFSALTFSSTSHPASNSSTSGSPPTTNPAPPFGGSLFGNPSTSSTSTSHPTSGFAALAQLASAPNSSTPSAPADTTAGSNLPPLFSGGGLFGTNSNTDKTQCVKTSDRGIVEAMQYFYREGSYPAVTSTEGLRFAIPRAFGERKPAAEIPKNDPVKNFKSTVDVALEKVPSFETFLRL